MRQKTTTYMDQTEHNCKPIGIPVTCTILYIPQHLVEISSRPLYPYLVVAPNRAWSCSVARLSQCFPPLATAGSQQHTHTRIRKRGVSLDDRGRLHWFQVGSTSIYLRRPELTSFKSLENLMWSQAQRHHRLREPSLCKAAVMLPTPRNYLRLSPTSLPA